MVNYRIVKSDELYHHGIKGQKWGVRRFQNSDGSLTTKGQKRYSEDKPKEKKGLTEKQKKALKIGAIVGGVAIVAGASFVMARNNIEVSKLVKEIGKGKNYVTESQKNFLAKDKQSVNVIKSPTTQKTQISKKPFVKKDLSDFEFNRLARVDASGKISYVNVPKDKTGYAKQFAQNMTKGETSGKDYEYWLKYMEDKLKYM